MNSMINCNVPAAPLRGQTNNATLIRSDAAPALAAAKNAEKENKKGIVTMISRMLPLFKINVLGRTRAAGAGLAALASVTGIAAPANAQTSPSWQPYGMVTRVFQQNQGPQVLSMNTSSELLSNSMTLTIYKSPAVSNEPDSYLIAGPFSHAVTPSVNNGAGSGWAHFSNSTSSANDYGVGWCGDTMKLDLDAYNVLGAAATVYSASPGTTSSLSSSTTSANVSTGGLSLDYAVTVDAPDVSMATDISGSAVSFTAGLMCPSQADALSGKLPHPTSQFGTTLQVAVIYQVPHATGLRINWDNDIWWRFFSSHTPTNSEFTTTSSSTTSSNAYNVGSVLADFGAPPTFKANGSVDQQANGPQIIDEQSFCLTSQNGTLSKQGCISSSNWQKWYYTANSQIVNVGSGLCLDIASAPGAAALGGDSLVLNPCSPALPTPACIASGNCPNSPVAPTQQWQPRNWGAGMNTFDLLSATGLHANPVASSTGYSVIPKAPVQVISGSPSVPGTVISVPTGFTFRFNNN